MLRKRSKVSKFVVFHRYFTVEVKCYWLSWDLASLKCRYFCCLAFCSCTGLVILMVLQEVTNVLIHLGAHQVWVCDTHSAWPTELAQDCSLSGPILCGTGCEDLGSKAGWVTELVIALWRLHSHTGAPGLLSRAPPRQPGQLMEA